MCFPIFPARCLALTASCAALLFNACSTTPAKLDQALTPELSVRGPQFEAVMGSLLRATFVGGNKITTLNNGDEIFPAMLKAIRDAQKTITFETYIYYKGKVGDEFAAALTERAHAGVKVNLMLDAVGALQARKHLRAWRAAGVEVERYHQLFYLPRPDRLNHRTHRKLLVVDGKVGFIGGVGIGDDWAGNARNAKEWRELHYQVEGPAVAQMQAAFNGNWLVIRNAVLAGPDYFPALKAAGSQRVGIFNSSPYRGLVGMELLYHLAIASSRQTLHIQNAYFVPDKQLVKALCAAARRGVDVRIVMPGDRHTDSKAVQRVSRRRWPELLAAGVKLYEYQPTMLHSKLLIADGLFVSVGSANFDPRSLRINDEANMNVLDAGFAREQTLIFERDLRQSLPVTNTPSGLALLFDVPWQILDTQLEEQL